MAMRYRLPEVLGGGEFQEHTRPDGSSEAPVGCVAFLVNGCLVTVARALVAEVEPPLPPEPQRYDTVVVTDAMSTVRAFQRLQYAGGRPDLWYEAGEVDGITWAQLCELGIPVRLVPDPAADAPPLPLELDVSGAELYVNPHPDQRSVWVAFVGHIQRNLPVDVARLAARALWAAADRAEAQP